MRKEFLDFLTSKGYTQANWEGFDDEKKANLQVEYLGELESKLAQFVDANTVKEMIDAMKATTVTTEQLSAVEQMVKALQDSQVGLSETAKGQILKTVKENHEAIVKSFKEKGNFEIQLKAAAAHRVDNSTVGTLGSGHPNSQNYGVFNEVAEIRTPEDFILNVIPNVQVNSVNSEKIRIEQAPKEGAFAVTTEGATKPLLQYKFVKTLTSRKKIAGRIEWSEEFEKDYNALFREIVRIFNRDFIKDWQSKIFAEIVANATPYVSSVLDGTFIAPDNGLAVVAGQSQVQSLNFTPNVVLMNPADVVATLFQQDANGNLKQHPYINIATGTINGMRLVSSNYITQGTAYVGQSDVYSEEHEAPMFRLGQYNDQFIKNMYTAILESFFILSIAELDLNSWVELDLDTVKTALTA